MEELFKPVKIFAFLKVLQDVIVFPTRVAKRFPFVIIFRVSSDKEHVIEDASASEAFATGPCYIQLTIVKVTNILCAAFCQCPLTNKIQAQTLGTEKLVQA